MRRVSLINKKGLSVEKAFALFYRLLIDIISVRTFLQRFFKYIETLVRAQIGSIETETIRTQATTEAYAFH